MNGMIEMQLSAVGDFRELLLLPTVFEGDRRACEAYAKHHGFRWVCEPEAGVLFGGYWANARGDCLMPV
jgi:hypothetical protein